MSKPRRKALPEFKSNQEASDWFDKHSTSDLLSTEVSFKVASPLPIYISDSSNGPSETIVIDKQLGAQIRQIAEKEGVSTEELLHRWLSEKVAQK